MKDKRLIAGMVAGGLLTVGSIERPRVLRGLSAR